MLQDKRFPFNIEWLPESPQHYNGPKNRMRGMLNKHWNNENKPLEQSKVIDFLTSNYSRYINAINKIKFYCILDDKSQMLLHFFLLWCDYDLESRELFFEQCEIIVMNTGWYPVVTGHRIFHHHRKLLDYLDDGLKKAMNKSNIEELPGLGELLGISNFTKGSGTSILIQTSSYDLILDAGMPEDELCFEKLRFNSRKWIFVSHSHKDHTGGMTPFIYDKKFVISASPISLELFFNAINEDIEITALLPKHFFYRFAPMWYRSIYHFSDKSSIETIPTYHFPGSMGYLFTFSDGKTLFYSGDFNVAASYLTTNKEKSDNSVHQFDLGRPFVNYGLLDAAFIGRKVGSSNNRVEGLLETIENSIRIGRNHLLLTPPSDYGLFLFLHLYDELISRIKRKFNLRIFIDSQIIRQLEILEWRMKRKQQGSLDDAMMNFLARRTTLAESVRVFDFCKNLDNNLDQLNHRNLQAVFILDDQKYDDHSYISDSALAKMEQRGLDISRVGKAATRPIGGIRIDDSRIIDFDGSIWLLHSSEEEFRNYILSGKQKYENVYLFHNFKGRVEKFARGLLAEGYRGNVSCL